MFPSTIGPLNESNTPGACKLQFALVDDIVSFPQEIRGTVGTTIQLREGATWTTIVPTKFTQAFKAQWVVRDGDVFEYASLGFLLPKDRAALLDALWKLKPGRYVVLHHDLNGTIKVMGTKTEPATVRVQQLQHGADPRREGNRYVAMVEVSRRTECPFYLVAPPVPGQPDGCPTLQDLVAEATWETLEGILSSGQLGDAEESICAPLAELIAAEDWAAIEALLNSEQLEAAEESICPTLCELIDAAFLAGGTPENGFDTTGAGETEYNTSWVLDGTSNGKDAYRSGTLSTSWSGTAWVALDDLDGTGWYQSTDDTTYPWEATGWTAVGTVSGPAPTLTQTGGGSTGAETIAACLSPEQGEELVEELGGVMTCANATVQLKDSAGNNIGSADSYASGSSSNKTAPDGTVTVLTPSGATMGAASVRSNGTADYVAPIPLKLVWEAGDADTVTWTVTADEAGVYTGYTSDGGSGTITYSKNGAGFAALTGTITLAVSDTIVVRRTTSTSIGFTRWVP